MSSYSQNLLRRVIELSESEYWKDAVTEWEIIDCYEDETLSESCICGKERLKYLFTIQNTLNQNTLYPIGSSCINKFNRTDLNEQADIQEKLFKLLHAVRGRTFITLTSQYFSRKLLKYFLDNNVFEANEYNQFTPEFDYQFLLKMFNSRTEPTQSEQRKINAIIKFSILPYLEELLQDKIIHN